MEEKEKLYRSEAELHAEQKQKAALRRERKMREHNGELKVVMSKSKRQYDDYEDDDGNGIDLRRVTKLRNVQ